MEPKYKKKLNQIGNKLTGDCTKCWTGCFNMQKIRFILFKLWDNCSFVKQTKIAAQFSEQVKVQWYQKGDLSQSSLFRLFLPNKIIQHVSYSTEEDFKTQSLRGNNTEISSENNKHMRFDFRNFSLSLYSWTKYYIFNALLTSHTKLVTLMHDLFTANKIFTYEEKKREC